MKSFSLLYDDYCISFKGNVQTLVINFVFFLPEIKKEIMQLQGKEQATSDGIMDFLNPEGAAVILGYYVEYYFEVFLAYNELRKDRGLKVRFFSCISTSG